MTMRRRDVFKVLGASLAALATASRGLAAAGKPWKTAVGLNGFMSSAAEFQQNFPIWEVLDFISGEGFDGVELVDGWPMGAYPKANEAQRIAALRRMYDQYGLKVFSLQTGAGGAFAAAPDDRKRWLADFHDLASFARAVGCVCIGLWPGGPLGKQTLDEAIGRLAESFREVGKIAGSLGLLAAFEIEPPFVFNSEPTLKAILEQTNHPNLKTIYDPSHFDIMNGSKGEPHKMLERIGVANIGYVHLTDTDGTPFAGTSRHLACGDGHAHIDESLAVLRREGFSGWIMIDAWKIRDPYDACHKGKQAIERARSKA